MTLIAFVTEPATVTCILELPTAPPQFAPARGPPPLGHAIDQTLLFDPAAPDPDPGFEFDQRVSW